MQVHTGQLDWLTNDADVGVSVYMHTHIHAL
jgi:hypothetical protein